MCQCWLYRMVPVEDSEASDEECILRQQVRIQKYQVCPPDLDLHYVGQGASQAVAIDVSAIQQSNKMQIRVL